MPTSVIGFVTGRSPTRISPVDRFMSPAIISISVLLPQPDAPTTDTNWPAGIVTLTSFRARNGVSVSSPKVFETCRMVIGTPDLIVAVDIGTSRGSGEERCGGGCNGVEGDLGDEQRLAAPLHDSAILVDDRDVEGCDRLGGTGPALTKLGQHVIHEDRVADEDRPEKPPVLDAEECHCR